MNTVESHINLLSALNISDLPSLDLSENKMITTASTLTTEKIQKAVDTIIDKMPPVNNLHRQVLTAFRAGDYVEVNHLQDICFL